MDRFVGDASVALGYGWRGGLDSGCSRASDQRRKKRIADRREVRSGVLLVPYENFIELASEASWVVNGDRGRHCLFGGMSFKLGLRAG